MMEGRYGQPFARTVRCERTPLVPSGRGAGASAARAIHFISLSPGANVAGRSGMGLYHPFSVVDC